MTMSSSDRGDATLRMLIRAALLALTSGTHHLPDGLSGSHEAEAARREIAEAHDAILACADMNAVAERLAAGIAPLLTLGFDPIRLYTLATVARVEGRPVVSKPVALGENVTRLPLSISPSAGRSRLWTEEDHRANEAARGRKRIASALSIALDGIVAQLPGRCDCIDSPRRLAADMAHELETFPSGSGNGEAFDDLARRWEAFERGLARGGAGTWELRQLLRHQRPIIDLEGREVCIGKKRGTRHPRRIAPKTPDRSKPSKR